MLPPHGAAVIEANDGVDDDGDYGDADENKDFENDDDDNYD